MQIILLGLVGAGKGTQAQMLAQYMRIAHVASGDLFRRNQDEGTQLGLLVKQYMDKGELVPDDITIQMIVERIKGQDCKEGFILDGFPRTIEQAEALDVALGERGVDCVLEIRVGHPELLRRLSGRLVCRKCQTPYHQTSQPPKTCGVCDRCEGELHQLTDDQPEVVERRIRIQKDLLAELVNYYSKQSKLKSVDGELHIDDVSEQLREALPQYGLR